MPQAAAVDPKAIAKTPGYQAMLANWASRDWRLDHAYKIIDENGTIIQFQRNAAQVAYDAARWSRDMIVKARQMGFSTFIEMVICDTCVFRSNINAGIVDDTLGDARKKLTKIKFAYDNLPSFIRDGNPLIKKNTEELQWRNGSKVTVGTSYRGDTAQILHISELGKTAINKPDQAHEVRTGALRAVHANGWAVIESTAHGTAGEFYDMVEAAKKRRDEKRQSTALEFKLHFFGWWLKPEYRLPVNLVVISQELQEYFAKTNVALKALGFKPIDGQQQAWYAVNYADLGPDDMRQEFPSLLEEAFFNSLLGAFWKREMSRARNDGRIGLPVPFDPTRRVDTWWDIGEDCTAIIFVQHDGVRYRAIDYHEEEGGSLQSAAAVLEEKKRERGFIYNRHIGPHDLDHRDWAHESKTRKETAKGLGIEFQVVPQVQVKADSIEAARRMIGLMWFDAVHCKLLVERLDNYRKKWNKALQVFSPEPVHDMASHGSDAFQQGAMAKEERLPAIDRSRPKPPPRRGSAWGA